MIVLLLVFSLVSLALGDYNWPFHDGPIQLSGSAPTEVSETLLTNLKRSTNILISHSFPVQICLQEVYPTPVDTNWWNQSCTRYWAINSGVGNRITDSQDAQLRSVEYRMAVALLDTGSGLAGRTDSVEFRFGDPGDSCHEEGEIFDGIICRFPDGNATINVPFPIEVLPTLNYSFYDFVVPAGAQSIQVQALGSSTASLTFQIRRAATPFQTDGLYDGTKGSIAVFNYPRPGTYFISAAPLTNGTATILITVNFCNASLNFLGPNCQDPFNVTNRNDMNMVAYKDQWKYWKIIAGPENPVFVSVRSFYGGWFPQVLASKDQLPRFGNNDLQNCHGTSCNGAMVMNITVESDHAEVWYIGVTLGYDAPNETQYGIWFNSVCAPNCAANGECIWTGPNIGECVCRSQYIGPDCAIQSQDMARFIVLCVIAGLLFGSAVVGWIVQKVQNYRAGKSQGSYEAL